MLECLFNISPKNFKFFKSFHKIVEIFGDFRKITQLMIFPTSFFILFVGYQSSNVHLILIQKFSNFFIRFYRILETLDEFWKNILLIFYFFNNFCS